MEHLHFTMPKDSRTPQGVRGLKHCLILSIVLVFLSHSARSAWIETSDLLTLSTAFLMSHSARSAWIETAYRTRDKIPAPVALRKECVD